MPKKIQRKTAPSGTTVMSIRLGTHTVERLEKLGKEWGVSPSQLGRFILTSVTAADVKRLVFASIKQINDEDRDLPSSEYTT